MTDLEIKLAHQDRMIEELNETIYEQQKSLEIIEIRLNKMIQRVKELGAPYLDVGPGNEKPPHY